MISVPPQWILMWLVRTLWAAFPQHGYIHPDEFFQSVEVIAGDVLDIKVYRTWEFNATNPIRSITLPYVLYSPAFYFIKFVGLENDPNSLLVFPRIVVTWLSFTTDLAFYFTCQSLNLDADSLTLVYVTSYVVNVYHTRTLSNTLESFFLAFLLLIITCCCRRKKTVAAEIHPRSRLTKAKRIKEIYVEGEDWHYAAGIAFIIVAGVFNRPTFVLYAAFPCLYWIISGYIRFWKDSLVVASAVRRILLLIAFAVPIKWMFILLDSAYYRDLDIEFSKGWYGTLKEFLVFTPWNFIRYNINTSNLAEHTLHPRFLHILVNAPIMFGFLSIFAYMSFFQTLKRLKYLVPHHDYTWKVFYLYTFIVPLLLHSLFPHQEPRFLVPLLFPLALLYGHHLQGPRASETWQWVWIVFNLLGCFFYGSLHQGGMIGAISAVKHQHHTQRLIERDRNITTELHVIFYNTYMPPRHLFAIPNEGVENNTLFVHDLKGAHPIEIARLVLKVQKETPCPTSIYIIAPRISEEKFCTNTTFKALKRLNFQLLQRFFLHISTENLPTLEDFLKALSLKYECSICGQFLQCVKRGKGLTGLFSLNLYRIVLIS